MADLPKKGELVKLDHVRIDRNAGKVCKCEGDRDVTINTKNKQVYCGKCGALLDAFQTLVDIAVENEYRNQRMEAWLEQAEEVRNYKPWLKIIRYIESRYRGKKYVPVCPRCNKPFFLEELSQWHNRELAERQIRKWRSEP